MGSELQRTKGSEGRAVTGRIIVSRAAPVSLRIVDQGISNHLNSASRCAPPSPQPRDRGHPLFEWALTLETVRRDRCLKRSCATLVPKMVNSSSSCRLPPKSEHHS